MAHSIACAELISLLFLLHSVPSVPSSNDPTTVPLRQEGYCLPVHTERSLVGTLAFLSNAKDDPNHVAALCIKEEQEPPSLSVLLAANRLTKQDGSYLLQELKQGFEEIFAILSQVSEDHDTLVAEADIFTAIISMCSYRILRRLHVITGTRKVQRQSIKEVLQTAICALKQLKSMELGDLRPLSILFTEKAKKAIKLADAWTKHQTLARLKELVEAIYCLKRIGDIQTLFSIVPNRVMCPSSRTNLLNIINKVARYQEAARILYRTAQKVALVRQMRIVVVDLPEQTFERLEIDKYTPRLASTIARLDRWNSQRDLTRICHLTKTTAIQADNQFSRQTRKTLKESKIHAEMQLIFYLELHPSKLPPRVISSSKDACYLCNAFIVMYGKVYMSKCHGRLYPGWRLPLLARFNDMHQKFNAVLENQVSESLEILFSRGRKTIYPYPNESTLLTLSPSTSTLRNPSLPIQAIGPQEQVIPISETEDLVTDDAPSIPRETQTLATPSEKSSSLSSTAESEAFSPNSDENSENKLSDHSAIRPLLTSSHGTQQALSASINNSETLISSFAVVNKSAIHHKSSLYTTGPLEIFVEQPLVRNLATSKCASSKTGYRIEFLEAEETKKLREHGKIRIIDVEALEGESTYEVNEQGCLFIVARGTVVKMVLY